MKTEGAAAASIIGPGTEYTMSDIKVGGHCDDQFAEVKRVFAQNFALHGEVGAGFSVYCHGIPVVNIWGGTRDRAQRLAWREDTLVNVFSATKGVIALCIHRLVERGLLDFDEKIASYWPNFSKNGKQDITLRMVLNHRSGLSAFKHEIPSEAIYDWATIITALEQESPWWVPGSRQGYQAFTFGWILGELIRRVTGLLPRQYFRQEFGKPLGLEFYIGLNSEQCSRVADVGRLASPEQNESNLDSSANMPTPNDVSVKAFFNPVSLSSGTNSTKWRSSEIPSANGHGTATALARIYGGLANGGCIDGVSLLGNAAIECCYTESSSSKDAVLQVPMRFGLGFMLTNPVHQKFQLGRGDTAFGHTGAGGSVGFGDPQYGLGIGYVTNRLGSRAWLDPRAEALISAVYDAI